MNHSSTARDITCDMASGQHSLGVGMYIEKIDMFRKELLAGLTFHLGDD